MSTYAYGALTTRREVTAPVAQPQPDRPPGVKTFVDAMTALVPAEVLAVHALVLDATTTSTTDDDGQVTTTITDPVVLRWVFAALIVVSVLLFIAGRYKTWERWDLARMAIPPLAFVAWTMLQKSTAFDAVAPDLSSAARYAIALIGAVLLGAAANALAYKADQAQPARGSDGS